MTILKTLLWFLLFLPLMVVVYNLPLSLAVSAYSKLRYGQVVSYARMPCGLVLVAMLATLLVAAVIVGLFDVDPAPVRYAAFMRVAVYAVFNY